MSARSIRRTHQRQVERDERRRGRRAGRAAIATGAALGAGALLAPGGAQAATFTVVTGGDAGDNTCDASCTLRDAIDDADATAAADTVVFAPAITGEIQLLDGEIEITEPLSIQGPGAGTLAISGDRDGDNQVDFKHIGEPGDSRIFNINPSYAPPPNETPVSISGLTLREGVASEYYGYYEDEEGGAIVSGGADLTLSNMVLTDNVASDDGGAIRSYGESLTLLNTTISNNTSYEDGGGIRASSYGYYGEDNQIRIVDSTVTGNTAGANTMAFGNSYGENGGGLDVGGEFEILRTTITGNKANVFTDGEFRGDGGGVSIYGDGTLRNSTVRANTAGDTGGGVLLGRSTVESTTISGNSAGDSGGGVSLKYGGVLRSSTVSGNEAPRGGGVSASAAARVFNSTISGNRATAGPAPAGLGGGVYAYAIDGLALVARRAAANPLVVRNSTVAANSAVANGGGIFASSENPPDEPSVQLKSSIVADNSGPGSGDDVAQTHGNIVSASFSLVESQSPAAILGDPPGSSVFGVDPGLGALAANGGATRTHALSATSAALDAGQAYGEATDQRGQARTVDAASSNPSFGDGTDMGAFEVQDATATGDDPDTEITKQPKATVKTKKKKKKVKFKFTGSDETDSAAALVFECSVDGAPFDTCVSPFKIKLPKGEHTFAVRAVDTDGNVDPSPSEAAVEVKKKKKKKKD